MLSGGQALTLENNGTAAFVGSNGIDAVRANGISFAGSATSANFSLGGASDANGNYTLSATAGSQTFTAVVGSASFTANALTLPTSVTLTSTNAQVNGTVVIDLNTAFNNNVALGGTAEDGGTVAGTANTSFTFKVGSGAIAAEDDLTFSIASLVAIGDTLAADVTTVTGAETSSAEVSAAIDSLNSARAQIGANQSRLDFAAANLATAVENTEASRSAMLDLDIASEMTEFTSKQTLLQAGVSMLAQANQIPQALLRLFQ